MPKGEGVVSGTKIHKRRGKGGPRGARVTFPVRGPSAGSHRSGGRREGDKRQGMETQCSALPTVPSAAALGDGGG